MNLYPELQDEKCPETTIIKKTVYSTRQVKNSLFNGIIKKTIVIILSLLFVIIVFS